MWSATVLSEAESSQDKVSPWAASTASLVSFSSSVSLLFSDTPQPIMMSNRHKLSKVAEMKRSVIFMFSFLSASKRKLSYPMFKSMPIFMCWPGFGV